MLKDRNAVSDAEKKADIISRMSIERMMGMYDNVMKIGKRFFQRLGMREEKAVRGWSACKVEIREEGKESSAWLARLGAPVR